MARTLFDENFVGGFFTRRIGNTTYRVRVRFSGTNTETAQEKIARLVRNEAAGKG